VNTAVSKDKRSKKVEGKETKPTSISTKQQQQNDQEENQMNQFLCDRFIDHLHPQQVKGRTRMDRYG
jgi:hypothetical protein